MTPQDATRIVTDPQAMADKVHHRLDAWVFLKALRGQRCNAVRLWHMQRNMPALTAITGLALPRHQMRRPLSLVVSA